MGPQDWGFRYSGLLIWDPAKHTLAWGPKLHGPRIGGPMILDYMRIWDKANHILAWGPKMWGPKIGGTRMLGCGFEIGLNQYP